MGLLVGFGDRLDLKTREWVQEFLDHNELGLALETMADALCQGPEVVSDRERSAMLGLVDDMDMDGRVSRALAHCPPSA